MFILVQDKNHILMLSPTDDECRNSDYSSKKKVSHFWIVPNS